MLSSAAAAYALIAATAAYAVSVAPSSAKDPASYVDTLIGTLGGGHVFAGPSTPFGSIKPGLDSDVSNNQAGFVSNASAPIFGISALHDDGTGGRPSLGMSSLLPQYCQLDTQQDSSGCKWTRDARRTRLAHSSPLQDGHETSFGSAPGEFHASLASLINVSFAASDHAAIFHFDYSRPLERGSWPTTAFLRQDKAKIEKHRTPPAKRANNMEPVLVFDHMTDLSRSGGGTPNSLRMETVNVAQASGSPPARLTRIRSSATFRPSFGIGDFQVFTCLDVPLVRSAGVYQDTESKPGITELSDIYNEGGAILTLDGDALAAAPYSGVLPVRMGISWTSTEAACSYAADEIPAFPSTRSLSAVAAQTRGRWNKLLSDTLSISHDGVTDDDLTLFYSSLYRSFLSPNNVTGDNPRFTTTKPSFDSLYCIWDSARTIHPLWALLAPKAQAEVLEAIVEIQKHEGWLPDCRMSTNKGYTQGGSNAEMMLSDSYVKGILHDDADFWNDAFQAMLKDAQVEPPSWGLVGRGGIEARAKLGYVPRGEWGSPRAAGATEGRTASRTIEYAYNDFSIALVAAGLGRRDLYDRYRRLSNDTFNLWNTTLESDGFTGFLQAREEDGSWAFQDPRRCSPALEPMGCFLDRGEGHDFYEASSWQYSLFAPHDMATVVKLMGGHERFVQRYIHMWTAEYADISDEPGFLAAYSANFARAGYAATVDTVTRLLRAQFATSTAGLPGNDDVGAMGSLVVWTYLGFFPVAGTGVYLLGTPLLSSYAITNQLTGKTFHLQTTGFDAAKKNKYIVKATLDGKPYTKNWLCHTVFAQGARLELTLADTPSKTFGMADADLPPSLSTGGYAFDSHPLGC